MIATRRSEPTDVFLPLKAAAAYLDVSYWWIVHNGHPSNNGFPQRVELSPRKIGYWKHEIDAWKKRIRWKRRQSPSAA